ncbi:MAG: hypothetical protein IPP87_07125 [Ideonella sp.]|nr:hypothetical protein [Ideonella sp.]
MSSSPFNASTPANRGGGGGPGGGGGGGGGEAGAGIGSMDEPSQARRHCLLQ